MQKRPFRNGDALREGYLKGLKNALQLIKESLGENPFEGTEEWELLGAGKQKLVSSYLCHFAAEQTLQATLEEAQERYVGSYAKWDAFGLDQFNNGGIDTEWLLDMDCVDWEQVGNILSNDYFMADNGMTFRKG